MGHVLSSLQKLSGSVCRNYQGFVVASLCCQVRRGQRQPLNEGKQQPCPVAAGLKEWPEVSLGHRNQSLTCTRSSTVFLRSSELEIGKGVAK